MHLVYDQSERVARWVAKRITFVGHMGFGECAAIGVAADDGEELAGVVFHDFQPVFKTLAFSMAARSPRWARKGIIRDLFRYPFEFVGVNKLWTATPHSNARALKALKGLGFTQEAILVRQFGKDNAVINRMFLKDYRKLYGAMSNGEAIAARAA